MFGRRPSADNLVLEALADGQWHPAADIIEATRMRHWRVYDTLRRLHEYNAIEQRREPRPGYPWRLVFRLPEHYHSRVRS
jgi:DNA-binding PadR family transcriptional regulator